MTIGKFPAPKSSVKCRLKEMKLPSIRTDLIKTKIRYVEIERDERAFTFALAQVSKAVGISHMNDRGLNVNIVREKGFN